METPPPVRFTLTLDPVDSARLSEATALLHRETGRPHTRAEALREALRRLVTPDTTAT